MARVKKTRCYTICYVMYNPTSEEPDDFYTATWFAYGKSKEDARDSFKRQFDAERENFPYDDNPAYSMSVVNVFEGFSC